jgi:hypothetical protein
MTKKAVGLAEYLELEEEQQFEILHRDAVYIGKRKADKQRVVLFQLYGFYVEVHYKHYRKQVERTVVTDNTDILQHYIDQVNIRGLDNYKKED